MACGRPVLAITENDSDLSRLIIEASCGIRSDPGCSDDLAMKIIQASDNNAKCEKMGAYGRKFVERNFKQEIITKKYDDLIEMLVYNKTTLDK